MARASRTHTTTPYWTEGGEWPQFPPLDADTHAEVVVVGCGITGLTAACLLAAEGRAVVLLERGRCAQAETAHTSAHLTMVTDTPLTRIAEDFGDATARATWDAGLAAIARIEAFVRDEQIDCAFERVPGYLHASRADDDQARFEKEASIATGLGFDAAFIEHTPLIGTPGVRFEHQARFHPHRYLAGLLGIATGLGVRVNEHSDVREFTGAPLVVHANGHTVTCQDIVLATHNPPATTAAFQTRLALYTSYVVGGLVPDALFWDTARPYHYLRIDRRAEHDLVMLGGEDHKTGQSDNTDACYRRLEKRFGTLGAMMACDRIAGRSNPWSELFAPNRTVIRRGLWDYLKENSDYPYLHDSRSTGRQRSTVARRRARGRRADSDHRRSARRGPPHGRRDRRAAVGGLHAHGLSRGLVQRGTDLGLSV